MFERSPPRRSAGAWSEAGIECVDPHEDARPFSLLSSRRRSHPCRAGWATSQLSAKWKEITGTFIREGYGLSETGTVVSVNPKSIGEFTGTTGVPLPSTDVKLIDDDDARGRPWAQPARSASRARR